MEKLRVGVLGASSFACQRHIPDLLATDEVALAAVCRRDPAALATVADHFGVARRYRDYRAMLEEAPLDAVLVSSPHALHHEHTRAALERGLHVLSDKPLALHAAEAEQLRDLATARGLTLLLAASPPYDPQYRYIRDRIAAGDLGPLHLVQACALMNADALGFFGHGVFPTSFPLLVLPTSFRADPDLGGGGYFQDVGSHLVAGLLVATGLHPVEVLAGADDPALDMRASVTIRCAGGALLVVTTVGDAFAEEREVRSLNSVLFAGGKGSLSTDRRGDTLLAQTWGGPLEAVPAEALPPHASPASNFVGVLRGRELPMLPLAAAVETVRVVEAAYRSAREGRPVRLV